MTIDLEKRKRIMTRSIKLGHCICDAQKSCPCDIFKEKNICLCAGERLDVPKETVRLTHLVGKTGCSSKIDQAFLKRILKNLPIIEDPKVLVGVPAGDDAGIYDLGNGKALVQTVDVFTPSVDDPYTFGQIAAANSVSDIYAMGGTPMTALSVIGFPVNKIADSAMQQILRGGIDKMAEAGVAIIGGHSLNDDEIKAGFAVTGLIEPDKIITNDKAQVGDVLILTKPIGTGIISFASQIDKAKAESIEAAARSMTALNKKSAQLMVEFGAHACTDITGFGLMGHLSSMAISSGVDVEITFDDIPLFPGVVDYVCNGIIPGAVERNKESSSENLTLGINVCQEMADICFDAQTSGGLLIAISPDNAQKFLSKLHKEGISDAAVIGKVLAKGKGCIKLKTNGSSKIKPLSPHKPDVDKESEAQQKDCCCNEQTPKPAAVSDNAEISEMQLKFQDFLKTVNTPGSLDAYTKQTIAISLSVLAKCEPCLKIQIEKAVKMGFSQKEIDEAAWMGISFGGSHVMMFYNNLITK